MEEKSSNTLENIFQAGMEEFSDKGFLGASLRQIVKKAGVTTGAFYGYFSSKEALFTAIVEPHAAALMGRYMEAQTTFAELPEAEQPSHMGLESGECIHWMVDYICRPGETAALPVRRYQLRTFCPQHGRGGSRIHDKISGSLTPPRTGYPGTG